MKKTIISLLLIVGSIVSTANAIEQEELPITLNLKPITNIFNLNVENTLYDEMLAGGSCNISIGAQNYMINPSNGNKFALVPGTYELGVICFGPIKNGLKQPLFRNEYQTIDVESGKTNTFNVDLKPIDPKIVITTIKSDLDNATYTILFRNGSTSVLDFIGGKFNFSQLEDINPPIAIYKNNGKIGDLIYDTYRFSLYPENEVELSLSSQDVAISVTTNWDEEIFNNGIIEDEPHGTRVFKIYEVPHETYKLTVQDTDSEKYYESGNITIAPNGVTIEPGSEISLDGDIEFSFDWDSINIEGGSAIVKLTKVEAP